MGPLENPDLKQFKIKNLKRFYRFPAFFLDLLYLEFFFPKYLEYFVDFLGVLFQKNPQNIP